MGTVKEQDLTLTGGFGISLNAARAGFLPVPLRCVPARALAGIAVYLRQRRDVGSCGVYAAGLGSRMVTAAAPPGGGPAPTFVLYRAADVPFTSDDRRRLLDGGSRVVYIPITEQGRFRRQVEGAVGSNSAGARDGQTTSEQSAIIYETSVELVNELLSEPDPIAHSRRLEKISRATTAFVLSNTGAFAHLFAASHHDFYTATHMVNVATWMVPLSYRLGFRQPDQLACIYQAGLLHDIGRVFIPEPVLNRPDKLTEEDWALVRQHPMLGWNHLNSLGNESELVRLVARQHHERLDGSGYPEGLRGDQIHRVSRICAVVDSFDAMTALRPFRKQAVTVSEAILRIRADTPARYDPQVVDAWLHLLGEVDDCDLMIPAALRESARASDSSEERRRNKRFSCNCPARVHILSSAPRGGGQEAPGVQVTVHNVARFGLGLLSPTPIAIGEQVRVCMTGQGWAGRCVQGHIVRCRAYQDGWHEVGVELFTADNEPPGG